MDNYSQTTMVLDGGLNFTKAKIALQPGTLLDCHNYEIVDRSGYKVIDGINRYDGTISPAQTAWMTAAGTFGDLINFATKFADGLYIYVVGAAYPFGLMVGTSAAQIRYLVIDANLEPISGQVIQTAVGDTFTLSADPVRGTAVDAEATVATLNSYASVARAKIDILSASPVGLHWFRDRLYSVVDDAVVYFTQTQSAGTVEIKNNSLITIGVGTSARVLNIELASGTWAAGTAAGTMQIEVLTGSWGIAGTVSVTAPTGVTTTVELREVASATDPNPVFASIWTSRNEVQAVDDGTSTGWNRTDLGWTLPFIEGNYYIGEFVKIERGGENNFTFLDSSTTFTTGASAINGSGIYGVFVPRSTGVNLESGPGWKSTAAPTVWATGPAIVTAAGTDDTTYVYASSLWTRPVANPTPATRVQGNLGLDNAYYWALVTDGGTAIVTTPTDFFSGYSRTPIILKDLYSLFSQIPEKSVITGVELSVKVRSGLGFTSELLDTQITALGGVAATTQKLIDTAADAHKFVAYIGNYDSSTLVFTPNGALKESAGNVSTTIGDYSTQSNASTNADFTHVRAYGAGAFSDVTFGGALDTWGSTIALADLSDPTFGLAISAYTAESLTGVTLTGALPGGVGTYVQEQWYGGIQTAFDQIQIKVYYTEPSARYYISDGVGGVVSVDLVNYVVASGEIVRGDAIGTLQVTNVTTVSGGKRTVVIGDTMHLSSAVTAGDKVAEIDIAGGIAGVDALDYNGLPSLTEIIDTTSKYQFITANFYGNDAWDAFYGVSGAGRAFTYDGNYFYHIYTDLDPAKDMPRHVAFHHFHLALGYEVGEVRMSVKGEADNFDGVLGASVTGIGDRITGLLPMRGATLGVFCENSIWAIVGTDFENFATASLAPSTGCLEYTAVDVGVPIYCDSRGVSTLSQSEKYGDFLGSRLSAEITPWLLPRLRRSDKLSNVSNLFNGTGIACAIPIRSKNQYRMFFKDGSILTMTLVGGEMAPQFTLQQYTIDESTVTYDGTNFVVPLAWSSQVDEQGRDRVHISHYSPNSEISAASSRYVYELDSGWSFDGKFIPYSLATNWDYGTNPAVFADLRKVNLHGLSYGFSRINMSVAADLLGNYSERGVEMSLPRNSDTVLYEELQPRENINSMAKRGRCFSLKFSGSNTSVNSPEPSHVCQVLIIGQTAPGAAHL